MQWHLTCVNFPLYWACWARPEAFLQSGAQADDSEVAEIEALIQQRLDARKAKDWAAADAARDRLNEMGIVLEDGPQGTTWRRK